MSNSSFTTIGSAGNISGNLFCEEITFTANYFNGNVYGNNFYSQDYDKLLYISFGGADGGRFSDNSIYSNGHISLLFFQNNAGLTGNSIVGSDVGGMFNGYQMLVGNNQISDVSSGSSNFECSGSTDNLFMGNLIYGTYFEGTSRAEANNCEFIKNKVI